MRNPARKIAFVIVASEHGTMIVNRFDYKMADKTRGIGLGFQILERSAYDPGEVDLVLQLLRLRQKYYGDGVVAIDCGANVGVHTVEWAKAMTGWGSVIAIEAQERLYYALAGNIAINNCFNARAIFAAVSSADGTMRIPNPDYFTPSSFGSLELKPRDKTEFIGQPIDYSPESGVEVRTLALDSLKLDRIDLIKIDVEGMEFDVLQGAAQSIARHRPVLIVEAIKTDRDMLRDWLTQNDYTPFHSGLNIVAVHASDKTRDHIKPAPSAAAGGRAV